MTIDFIAMYSLALALSEEIQKSKSMQDTTKLSKVEQKESQT